MRVVQLTEIEEQRARIVADAEQERNLARSEAQDLRAAAKREADQLRLAAEQESNDARVTAQREAEKARAAADREVQEARRTLAVAKESRAKEAAHSPSSAPAETPQLVEEDEPSAAAADTGHSEDTNPASAH